MLRKNVVAIIPARGNSKRIPGKNYKMFNGKSIIANTIEKLKKNQFLIQSKRSFKGHMVEKYSS